jgi:dephospho-CoA kinase
MMLVIGLTGSIGMGKSTAARHFADGGIAVFDADAEVHRLYEGEAVLAIAANFPGVVSGGKVDRTLLASELATSPGKLKQLEAIVHPMVVKAELDFLRQQEARGAKFAVLEIPLLFETGADKRVDVSVVVSAPEGVQRARALARPGMTAEKLDQLLKRQLPDNEKCARADYVVDSSKSIADMGAEIDRLIESLGDKQGRVMERIGRGDFN